MNERFSDPNSVFLKGIAACNPGSSVFLLFQELKPFAQMYNIDVSMLETEVNLISHSLSTIDAQTIAEFGVYLMQGYQVIMVIRLSWLSWLSGYHGYHGYNGYHGIVVIRLSWLSWLLWLSWLSGYHGYHGYRSLSWLSWL